MDTSLPKDELNRKLDQNALLSFVSKSVDDARAWDA